MPVIQKLRFKNMTEERVPNFQARVGCGLLFLRIQLPAEIEEMMFI